VQVVSPDFLNQYRQEHPKHRRDIEELKRQELARRARAVYYYLKGLFEIVDLGYADLGELLVGQLVLPGRKETLYQRYGQGLESGELGLPVNTTPLALTAKITSELEIEDAEYEVAEEK
jgi:hypothetical protein